MGWDADAEDENEETNRKQTKLSIDADLDLKTGKIFGQKSRSAIVNEAMKSSVLTNIDSMDSLSQFAVSERKEKELKKVILIELYLL